MFPEARVSQLLESCYLVQGGTGVVEECHCTKLREEKRTLGAGKQAESAKSMTHSWKPTTTSPSLIPRLQSMMGVWEQDWMSSCPHMKCMQPSLRRKVVILSILRGQETIVTTEHKVKGGKL